MHSSDLDFTNQKIDRYSFLKRLGKGKLSAVWLAHDNNAKRDVAIKVLAETSENSATFEQTRLSFERDLQALAALRHGENPVALIFGNPNSLESLRMFFVFVDEHVRGLIRAELVIPDRLILVLGIKLAAFFGLGIAAIEEAFIAQP